MREIERGRRQKYLIEALKIPGIERCFTMPEIEELYQSFRSKKASECRWI